jgi:hypothetical protein
MKQSSRVLHCTNWSTVTDISEEYSVSILGPSYNFLGLTDLEHGGIMLLEKCQYLNTT